MYNNNAHTSSSNKYWTTERRRTAWYVMAASRKILRIKIAPVITTAFSYLQNAIRLTDDHDIPLLLLITASISSASKNKYQEISIKEIFDSLLVVVNNLPSVTKAIILKDMESNKYENQALIIELVKHIESHIISLPENSKDASSPFDYLPQIYREISKQFTTRIREALTINMCFIVCNENCPLLPSELCAAAAYYETLKSLHINEKSSFISKCINRYGRDCINFVVNLIKKEMEITLRSQAKACQ